MVVFTKLVYIEKVNTTVLNLTNKNNNTKHNKPQIKHTLPR